MKLKKVNTTVYLKELDSIVVLERLNNSRNGEPRYNAHVVVWPCENQSFDAPRSSGAFTYEYSGYAKSEKEIAIEAAKAARKDAGVEGE